MVNNVGRAVKYTPIMAYYATTKYFKIISKVIGKCLLYNFIYLCIYLYILKSKESKIKAELIAWLYNIQYMHIHYKN